MPKNEITLEQAIAGAKKMSENYVARGPYKFYPDATVVDLVQRGLAENQVKQGYRYCP